MNTAEESSILEASYCSLLVGAESTSSFENINKISDIVYRNWQVQPLIYSMLECRVPDAPGADWRRFVDSSIAIRAFSEVQLRALGTVCEALSAAGIPYALLKSSAVRLELYSEPIQRTGWDIDVAVNGRDCGAAAAVLQAAGYQFAQFNPATRRFAPADPRLRAAVEAEHYELGFLVRRHRVKGLSPQAAQAIRNTLVQSQYWHTDEKDELCCYTTIDVHHGLSLEIPTSYLVASARPLEWSGQKVWVPNLAWLAFHVIYKLYWEGVHAYGKGLYQYADVCRIVRRMSDLDVEELVALLDGANVRAAAYYVLRRLPTAFQTVLPPNLAAYVHACGVPEQNDPMRSNDLGDVWEKLWGRR